MGRSDEKGFLEWVCLGYGRRLKYWWERFVGVWVRGRLVCGMLGNVGQLLVPTFGPAGGRDLSPNGVKLRKILGTLKLD